MEDLQVKQPLNKRRVTYFDGVTVYLFAILGNLGAQLLVSIAGGVIDGITGKNILSSDYFQLVCMLVFQLAFLAVPVIYCWGIKKFRPVLYSPISKPAPEVFISAILPFVTIFGFYLPALYFSSLLQSIGYRLNPGVDLSTPGKMILGIIVMCVAAPAVEELIFRGFLLSGLRSRYNDYVASLLCAVAFTLMHMNPEQTVYQFFLGYTCALTAIKCRNLIAPIIIHSLSNLIAILVSLPVFYKPILKATEYLNAHTAAAAAITVGLALCAAAIIWGITFLMGKLRSRRGGGVEEAQEESKPNDGKTATVLYWVTAGLCLVMWLIVFASSMITLPQISV